MTNGRWHPQAVVALILGAMVVAVSLALVLFGSLLGQPFAFLRGTSGFLLYTAFMAAVVAMVGRFGPRHFPNLPIWRNGKWIIWALLLLSLGYQCVE